MANVYVYSGAAGAGTGADWTNAYTTVAAALTAKAAGDDFWVAHDHVENVAAAITWTAPGTLAAPNRIICVNRAGSVPPVGADIRATAQITTTGSNGQVRNGYAYVYGFIFTTGTAGGPPITIGSSSTNWIMENCTEYGLVVANFGYGSGGASPARVKMKNCILKMGVNASLAPLGAFEWDGGSWDGSVFIPTFMMTNSNSRMSNILIENVDLSVFSTGKTLVGSWVGDGLVTFRNCKLNATLPTLAATPTGACRVEFVDCDSGTANWKNILIDRHGRMDADNSVVRTGGASDGTTGISHKLVPNGNAKWQAPFRSKPITFWNESLSAITITLQGIWGGGAVPNNNDIWMDVTYPSDASSPLASVVTTGLANAMDTPVAYAAGSGTWSGSTTKFAMSKTITALAKGPIIISVKAVNAGPLWIDPKPIIT